MSYSPRTFILGPDDTLYRLASAKFSRMVDDPESHRLERFAGQRVRMAEAIVEVRVGHPASGRYLSQTGLPEPRRRRLRRQVAGCAS